MFYWQLPSYSIGVDAIFYRYADYWIALELSVWLAFTTFGLMLGWASNAKSKWFLRALVPAGLVGMLLLVLAETAAVVAIVQSIVFVLFYLLSSRAWKNYEIRDVMGWMLLLGAALAVLTRMSDDTWQYWPFLLGLGALFGFLVWAAVWSVNSRWRVSKWVVGIGLPYTVVLVVILGLARSKWRWARCGSWTLAAVVSFPVAVMLGDLLYRAPIPPQLSDELGVENVLPEIVEAGEMIYSTGWHRQPTNAKGPDLSGPLPTTISGLREIVTAYASQRTTIRVLADRPAAITVNYEMRNPTSFDDKTPHRDAVWNLALLRLAEIDLAFLEGRTDDALAAIRDGFDFDRQIGQGGLPSGRELAHSVDFSLMKELSVVWGEMDAEQCRAMAARLVEQVDAFESADVLMARRRAWEDRVPRWDQQLAMRYFFWKGWATSEVSRVVVHEKFHAACCLIFAQQLATLGYQRQFGELPESADDLVPEFLDAVPIDPFSKEGDRLRYVRGNDEFQIYSVYYNGIDDRGQEIPRPKYRVPMEVWPGDLTIDRLIN